MSSRTPASMEPVYSIPLPLPRLVELNRAKTRGGDEALKPAPAPRKRIRDVYAPEHQGPVKPYSPLDRDSLLNLPPSRYRKIDTAEGGHGTGSHGSVSSETMANVIAEGKQMKALLNRMTKSQEAQSAVVAQLVAQMSACTEQLHKMESLQTENAALKQQVAGLGKAVDDAKNDLRALRAEVDTRYREQSATKSTLSSQMSALSTRLGISPDRPVAPSAPSGGAFGGSGNATGASATASMKRPAEAQLIPNSESGTGAFLLEDAAPFVDAVPPTPQPPTAPVSPNWAFAFGGGAAPVTENKPTADSNLPAAAVATAPLFSFGGAAPFVDAVPPTPQPPTAPVSPNWAFAFGGGAAPVTENKPTADSNLPAAAVAAVPVFSLGGGSTTGASPCGARGPEKRQREFNDAEGTTTAQARKDYDNDAWCESNPLGKRPGNASGHMATDRFVIRKMKRARVTGAYFVDVPPSTKRSPVALTSGFRGSSSAGSAPSANPLGGTAAAAACNATSGNPPPSSASSGLSFGFGGACLPGTGAAPAPGNTASPGVAPPFSSPSAAPAPSSSYAGGGRTSWAASGNPFGGGVTGGGMLRTAPGTQGGQAAGGYAGCNPFGNASPPAFGDSLGRTFMAATPLGPPPGPQVPNLLGTTSRRRKCVRRRY